MKNQYVIAVGNPFDGLALFGPFDDYESAAECAEIKFRKMAWDIVRILPPDAEY